ncbi:hypothetical protein [Veronia nyctiphanis]|uniref:hypothetical protein n=1 Tax=Veronia nyctiphanis TaxID=1278244 RepID=UPI001375EA08|nr:hypothetical protein [Veronia nyctiphanis]
MNNQDIQRITDCVFPEYQAAASFCDILVVLGSAKAVEYKMPDAVSLYHQGKASKL